MDRRRERRLPSFAYLLLLLLFPPMLCVAQLISSEVPTAAPVLETMKLLRTHTIPDDSPLIKNNISPKLLRLQTLFKHQVRDLIVELLNHDQALSVSPPAQIRAAIRARLKAMRLVTRTKDRMSMCSFGHVLDVMVSTPPGHPDLLALGVVVDLSWTEEQSLYILQRQSPGWVNVLSAEMNDYPHVEYAQSSWFDYVLSPSAADGSWYLVTVSVKPFMASSWQYINYSALAPGPDGDHPRVLVRRRHQIHLITIEDEAHPCKLKVTADWFRVTIPVQWTGLKPIQRYRDEYRLVNGKAQRLYSGCYASTWLGKSIECDR